MDNNGEDYSMRIPFKNDPLDFNQRSLFPSYVFDLLPDNHDCFVYDDIFRQIDISIALKKKILG